jgi:hypothetical protein
MVVPKMVRPAAKSEAAACLASAPPEVNHAAAVEDLPRLARVPREKFLLRHWRRIVLAVIGIAAITLLLLGRSGTNPSAAPDRPLETAGAERWSRQSILPAGRSMSFYDPSRTQSDYRIEFGWVPDGKGVGWVFRMQNAGDYYASRLTLVQPGARLILAEEHFMVSGGVESPHSRKIIPLLNNSGLVRVRMDAIGPAFTFSLQGNAVDSWADARLGSGAAGFYDDHGQRPELQGLHFTIMDKDATRTAVTSLP